MFWVYVNRGEGLGGSVAKRSFRSENAAWAWAQKQMQTPPASVEGVVNIEEDVRGERIPRARWTSTGRVWRRDTIWWENPMDRDHDFNAAVKRTANYLAYRALKQEIHDMLIADGWSEEEAYLIYKAAKVYSSENPISPKTKDALIAAGFTMGGLALILYMVSKLPKKQPAPQPSQPPQPQISPVNFTEPTYYVYQRFIDNLDTQLMKCTLPQFVAALPKSAADQLARELTTRTSVGGSGIVAVSTNKAMGSECNWRRTCLADGSCVGVVGLQ